MVGGGETGDRLNGETCLDVAFAEIIPRGYTVRGSELTKPGGEAVREGRKYENKSM